MIYLFDKNQKLYDVVTLHEQIFENSQKSVLNGVISGVVSFKYNKKYEDTIYFGVKDTFNPNIFYMYKVLERRKESGVQTFFGVHVFYDDLKGVVIRDRRPRDETAYGALSIVLEGTGWTVGKSEATTQTSGSFYYESALSAYYRALDIWRCEAFPRMEFANGKITGKYLDLADELSSDRGKWFTHGKNLLKVIAEENSENLFTAFIGRGRGEEVGEGFGRRIRFNDVLWSVENGDPTDKPLGQDYVEIVDSTQKYGYPDGRSRTTVVEFPDIEDPEILLEETYNYAVENSRPKIQLRSEGLELDHIELGETVTIVRDDLNIRYKTRVYALERDFLSAKVSAFEMGDQIRTTEAKRIQAEQREKEVQREETISLIRQAMTFADMSYSNSDAYIYDLKVGNEYDLPSGLYSFDRPIDEDPTSVTYIGTGLLLMANEKNSDGTWKWNTAIENGRIVGSSILAHSITVNELSPDVGQNLSISGNVDIVNKVDRQFVIEQNELNRSDLEASLPIMVSENVEEWENNFVSENLDPLRNQVQSNTENVGLIVRRVRIGDGEITISASDNAIDLNLTNDSIAFRQSGKDVATMNESQLVITNGRFLETMSVGEFKFVPRRNGNLSII